MASFWEKQALPVITTILFSYFVILIILVSVVLSHFLRTELKNLINRYGRDNIVKLVLQGNIRGLLDLFIRRRRAELKKIQNDEY